MSTSSNTGGVSFLTLLGVLFIGLKLGGVITWPWVWVLAPIWIPWGIVLAIIFVIFLGSAFS